VGRLCGSLPGFWSVVIVVFPFIKGLSSEVCRSFLPVGRRSQRGRPAAPVPQAEMDFEDGPGGAANQECDDTPEGHAGPTPGAGEVVRLPQARASVARSTISWVVSWSSRP